MSCRYGGTAHSGEYKGERLTPGSAYEAIGAVTNGKMDMEDFEQVECADG